MSAPAHGAVTITVNADGKATARYTPQANYHGIDSFREGLIKS